MFPILVNLRNYIHYLPLIALQTCKIKPIRIRNPTCAQTCCIYADFQQAIPCCQWKNQIALPTQLTAAKM